MEKWSKTKYFDEIILINTHTHTNTCVHTDTQLSLSLSLSLFLSLSLYIYIYIYTNFSARARCYTRWIFKRSLTVLNSKYPFSSSSCRKVKEPSLPNYLSIASVRRVRCMPFPRVLMLCEMQTILSRIWTQIDMFISKNDGHYITITSNIYQSELFFIWSSSYVIIEFYFLRIKETVFWLTWGGEV